MTEAADVVRYIKAKRGVYGEMHVQKLLYYAQAWSLAWTGRPLFSEPVEAWKMGPVVRSVRYMVDVLPPDTGRVSADQAAVIDAVLAEYGPLNGGQLSELTHAEAPWAEVYNGRHDQSNSACSDVIAHDAMRRFYAARARAGEGPEPPRVSGFPREDDVLAVAAANADLWREALELLGK